MTLAELGILQKYAGKKLYLLSQEEISCVRKEFPVTGRNFLSKEDIFFYRKIFPFTGRHFLPQEEISLCRKPFTSYTNDAEKDTIINDDEKFC